MIPLMVFNGVSIRSVKMSDLLKKIGQIKKKFLHLCYFPIRSQIVEIAVVVNCD
jgi:hypothetical protein